MLALTVSVPAQEGDLTIERLAQEGWLAARALAPIGAPRDRLGPVNRVLQQLDALISREAARYADAAIRAALAAAQEERDEMAVYLAHARDLSNQMALSTSSARWPLPIDELEGELWFEVDRFQDAREAYERATKATGSPRAWLGLARVTRRFGDTPAACAAYKRIATATADLSESEKIETAAYLLGCR